MPRRGENIYKRKDGRWEGRYIKEYDISNKAHYGYIYGRTYNEVKSKLKNTCVENTICNEYIHVELYDVILDQWLKAVQINVKESTYARYYQLVKTHISPILGKYSVEKLSSSLLEQYTNSLLKSGRLDGTGGLSPKTVSDILTVIKSSLKYARNNEYLVKCKTENITVKKTVQEIQVLSVNEQTILKNHLIFDINETKFGVLLCLYTGIRIGELCALRWEHLDLKRGILSIRETMQRIKNVSNSDGSKTHITITSPKSACSIRDIPLPLFLIELAKDLESSPKSFVLTGSKTKFIEPRTLQNRFKKIVSKCDIPEINYHILRHTFATRCIEVGFEIKSLSEILGHANVNITLNRYVHSSFELKQENMEKLCATVNQ